MYDEDLADAIRNDMSGVDYTEKKMFGGLAFMVGGNMVVACNASGGMMVRVDPGDTESLVDPPHVDLFEMGGRRMGGWLKIVDPGADLADWVERGVTYASSLPPK